MALRRYRVREGRRHGIADLGPGSIVEMEEAHARGFLDKLEPLELVEGGESVVILPDENDLILEADEEPEGWAAADFDSSAWEEPAEMEDFDSAEAPAPSPLAAKPAKQGKGK